MIEIASSVRRGVACQHAGWNFERLDSSFPAAHVTLSRFQPALSFTTAGTA
jgi:hypothetical protein